MATHPRAAGPRDGGLRCVAPAGERPVECRPTRPNAPANEPTAFPGRCQHSLAPRPAISVIRPPLSDDPLLYDPGPAFASGGLCGALDALADRLDAARAAVIGTPGARQRENGGVAGDWIGLPDRILADFRTERPGSDLARLLKTARRIREAVDRVVLLGDRELLAGPRAVFEACSHPHHNELPRWERGGRPRLSFGECDFDNDATQGLLDLVAPRRDAGGVASGPPDAVDLLDRWGMVVVDRGGGGLATAATMRVFLATLLGQMGDGAAELVVPITATAAPLTEAARGIGCAEAFSLPAGLAGPASIFTAAGLLPSAIVGIDVVRLLEGAASMHRRFREAPVAANPVLQFAGVAHLADTRLGGPRPMLVPWNSRLEGVVEWYDALRAGSARACSPRAGGALAGGVADPGRSRRADGPLETRLRVAEPRRDRLSLPAVEQLTADEDQLAGLVGTTWPVLQDAAVTAAREAEVAAGRPAADLLLPRLDEHAVGQLLEMLMLATLVESRLGASPAAGTSPA